MPEPTPSLLFVCVENSNRSQMAEGFSRALGSGHVTAYSAGSRPSVAEATRSETLGGARR
jgi:arsenate reductase